MQCISLESDPLVQRIKESVKGNYVSTHKFLPSGIIISKEFGSMAQQIKNMTVRPDDIWIITYPKTGTTVLQEATWMLKNNLNFEKARQVPLSSRVPFLEARAIALPGKTFQSVDEFDNMPSPRIIKTHLPPSLLPDTLWTVRPKVIATYRNPKDVMISYYHHSRLLSGNEGSFEEFAEWFLADKYQFSPYWPTTLGLWEKRNETNVLYLLFENIVQNLPKCLQQLIEFLEVQVTAKDEEDLLEHLSLARMRSNPSVNYEDLIRERSKEPGNFVRSAKIDEWRGRLSKEMIDRFDEWSARFLKNSDFPHYY